MCQFSDSFHFNGMICWLIIKSNHNSLLRWSEFSWFNFYWFSLDKKRIKIKELSQYHLIFNSLSSDVKLSLIQVSPVLIFTFSTSIKHLRYMQEIGQSYHNNNNIHGLKQIIQSTIKKPTKINPLFGFATPRLRELLTHTWI